MDVKLVEIRDLATFISAMAIRLRNRTPKEFFLLRRAGYGKEEIGGPEETPGVLAGGLQPYIILKNLTGGVKTEHDPYSWGNRTMANAHMWLMNHWAEFASGDVLDVQFILGETDVPKESEASER